MGRAAGPRGMRWVWRWRYGAVYGGAAHPRGDRARARARRASSRGALVGLRPPQPCRAAGLLTEEAALPMGAHRGVADRARHADGRSRGGLRAGVAAHDAEAAPGRALGRTGAASRGGGAARHERTPVTPAGRSQAAPQLQQVLLQPVQGPASLLELVAEGVEAAPEQVAVAAGHLGPVAGEHADDVVTDAAGQL